MLISGRNDQLCPCGPVPPVRVLFLSLLSHPLSLVLAFLSIPLLCGPYPHQIRYEWIVSKSANMHNNHNRSGRCRNIVQNIEKSAKHFVQLCCFACILHHGLEFKACQLLPRLRWDKMSSGSHIRPVCQSPPPPMYKGGGRERSAPS
jgi:hypothetical protein